MTDATQTLQPQDNQAIKPVKEDQVRPVFSPRADVRENGEAIEVIADMPGVTQAGLEITLERNRLTIRGQVEDRIPEAFRPSYREYEEGNYERSFVLSNMVDREHIAASLKDGVLHLILPKIKEAMPQKIQIAVS